MGYLSDILVETLVKIQINPINIRLIAPGTAGASGVVGVSPAI